MIYICPTLILLICTLSVMLYAYQYRVIKKYNRRTKSFYFVEDKISKSFQLTDFSTIDTAPMLRDYYARIDKYYYTHNTKNGWNLAIVEIV